MPIDTKPNAVGPVSNLQSDDLRRPFPYINAFRPFVMEEFTRRKSAYPPSPASPFIRLTSCQLDPKIKYAFFTLGLHGFSAQDLNIFDTTYGAGRDIVGYAYDLTSRKQDGTLPKILISSDQLTELPLTDTELHALSDDERRRVEGDRQDFNQQKETLFAAGAHPIPGITDVQIQRLGIGTSLRAVVRWRCYNRAQMEFLRAHFMIVGNHVVLEWGNEFSDIQLLKTLDFSDDNTVRSELTKSIIQGRRFIINRYVKPNNGNYDFMAGSVANFQIDLDDKTGIYECMTVIVSVSEQMWGLNNHFTFVDKASPDGSLQQQRITTIADFFKIGGRFDVLINEFSTQPKYVAGNVSDWRKSAHNFFRTLKELVGIKTNPEDNRFVSWEFFTKIILPNLYSLLSGPNIKRDLFQYINFYNEPTEDDPGIHWIGDNPNLRTTDANTMLIIKRSIGVENIPEEYRGAGYFDDFPDANGFRGRLSKGIWLNAGAIREVFLSTNSFEQAIQSLLIRMNNATANYWQLRLYFDDEKAHFHIVDYKTGDLDTPPMYKFNVGGKGEVLRIELDSSFPPELISQMMLFAKFRTETPAKQQELIEEMPLIGTTSTYVFSANWTNLEDILEQDLRIRRKDEMAVLPDTLTALSLGTDSGHIDNSRTSIRVGDIELNAVGPAMVDSKNTTPATPLGGKLINIPDAAGVDATSVPIRRNSVKPVIQPAVDPNKVFKSLTGSKMDKEFVEKFLRLQQLIVQDGHDFIVVETYRNPERQQMLYKKGRFGNPGRVVTNIDGITKESQHTKGRATDGLIDGSYERTKAYHPRLTELAESVGLNTIDVQFGDYGHVELRGGKNQTIATIPSDATNVQLSPAPLRKEDESEDDDLIAARKKSVVERFGSNILALVEFQPGAMINRITGHGYKNHPNLPNNFVSPFPTTTKITLHTLGIGGISITDGFFVDKLPFIFERHGCFQVVEVNEQITQSGWITIIRGVFKLLWLEPTGPAQTPISDLELKNE